MAKTLASLIALAFSCALLAGEQRPNILLLLAEDLGSRVAAFGDATAVTPAIDALAQRGVRYTNTYTTAGVCAPSRAALITGVHQNALGAGHMRSHGFKDAKYFAVPPPEVKAFPELLRRAGYFTYQNGKLDYQFSNVQPHSGPFTIWDAESQARQGVSWRDRPTDKPFFGMVNFMETHESGVFPRDVWPRSVTHLAMMLMHGYYHWGVEDVVDASQVAVPPYLPDSPVMRRDIARQYNNTHLMDGEVAKLLNQLEADGLADNTIVIWTSDHGDGLPRAKRELFDSGIKVPLVIYWPEKYRPAHIRPGSVDSRLVSFVDIAPTILAMAGIDSPGFIRGHDVVNPDNAPRKYIYAARDRLDEAVDRQRAVRDRRFKYIRNDMPELSGARRLAFRDNQDGMRALWQMLENNQLNAVQRQWFEPRPEEALYDTEVDPHEINNLVANQRYSDKLEEMRNALNYWQRDHSDWGLIDEYELAERSWPAGEAPVTGTPDIRMDASSGNMLLSAKDKGASIGYKVNKGKWLLYADKPISVSSGDILRVKAVRYGWRESEAVILTIE